jgi:hypothetical protein
MGRLGRHARRGVLGYTYGKILESKVFNLSRLSKSYPSLIKVRDISRSGALPPLRVEDVLRVLLDDLASIHNSANKPQVIKSFAKELLKRVEDAEDGYQIMLGPYEKKIDPASTASVARSGFSARAMKKPPRKAAGLVDDRVVRKFEGGRF